MKLGRVKNTIFLTITLLDQFYLLINLNKILRISDYYLLIQDEYVGDSVNKDFEL